jgi:hypothetical protein
MRPLLVILCTVLVAFGAYGAETGGFPSRPKLQGVGIQAAAPANGAKIIMGAGVTDPGWDSNSGASEVIASKAALFAYEGGADIQLAANAYFDGSAWRCITSGLPSAWVIALSGAVTLETSHANCASAGALIAEVNDFNIDALTGNITAPGGGSVPWSAATTGTFNLTYTSGCGGGTSTASAAWTKNGKQVSILITAATQCSGAGASITFAGVPSNLWPTTAQETAGFVATGAGQTPAFVQVNNGGPLIAGVAPAATSTLGLVSGEVFTYYAN